ncbi:MAG TPA: hypothetical protein VFJ58_23545 [Armatimonadota bacterium]|nr:hypothetical protein [Armatimonadota bacterium]
MPLPTKLHPIHAPRRRGLLLFLAASAISFGPAGCARYPATVAAGTKALLFVTLQVQGQINPSYYYFVALQASPTTNAQDAHPELGPFAIVQANSGVSGWGNGWGTGIITDYVEYHAGQASEYSIDTSNPATTPAAVAAGGVFIGPPFSTSLSGSGNALTVAVPLANLGLNGMTGSTATRALPGGVVVNVITTDHIENNPNAPPKPVDSLDQGSLPLLDLHQSKVVDLTPTGNVLFPNPNVNSADLQLTRVELEVRLP